MTLLKQKNLQTEETLENQREQIKRELRQKINETLQNAKNLSPSKCLDEIRSRLFAIQQYCKVHGKTFIAIEETITCDQYGLGGNRADAATLFRGPNVDASVAICVSKQGSLLHRDGSSWQIYKNAGDVDPSEFISALKIS
ncbi:MAG: hypothetical protein KME15_21020 [Drouetiella hepatica Uher 2000/2452]|jgi:hypothetical protein|uniref:Uncharacterized protein n=1 Tax=Drouetiella hepatica Uher 2000/2452 TaxID=904376 RepID=A0A951QEH2_9CYAN|nr:hypothetical protein [Drouetiella hepatica Uher 2000/2452]